MPEASILWLLLRPYIPVAIFGLRIATCLLKPWMFIGGVVDYQIDEHAHSALFTAMREFDKVAERAVARINAVVVCDIVSVILTGRRLKRHQPDGCDTHSLQIIQAAHQSLKVSNAVSVSIHIGSD